MLLQRQFNTPADDVRSPTTPPRPRHLIRASTTVPNLGPSLRTSRSIDNFSRPAPRSPTSPKSPLSGRASRNGQTSPTLSRRGSIQPRSIPQSPTTSPMIVQLPVGNAVTTEDDSARVLIQKPLPPLAPCSAESIAESSEDTPATSISSPSNAVRSPLKHARSSPSLLNSPDRSKPLKDALVIRTKRISSIDEDPIPGTPFVSDHNDHHTEGNQSLLPNLTKSVDDETWEDDIDYCYEHEAEADCEFEWGRRSTEGDCSARMTTRMSRSCNDLGQITLPIMHESTTLTNSYLLPSPVLPALVPQSAHSTSTFNEIRTPDLSFDENSIFGDDQPHPAIYNSDHLTEDADMYGGMFIQNSDEKGFPIYTHMGKRLPPPSLSSRGSHSSMSKGTARDSTSLSRAASIVNTHRSSNSVGSLPELVHSMTGTEKHGQRDSMVLARNQSGSKLSVMTAASVIRDTTAVAGVSGLREKPSMSDINEVTDTASEEEEEAASNTPTSLCAAEERGHGGADPETLDLDQSKPLPKIPGKPMSVHHGHSMSEAILSSKPNEPMFAGRNRAYSAAAPRFPPRQSSSRVSYSLFPIAGPGCRSPPAVAPEAGNFF